MEVVTTSDPSDDSGWLIEPPATDGAIISLEVATDAELTPELRQAIEALALAVEALGQPSEVEGFARAGICDTNMGCSPQSTRPCFSKLIVDCRIIKCPTFYVPTP
ncbi:MAG: hypothetical protein QOE35_2288 [Actinomycetota bacterium]